MLTNGKKKIVGASALIAFLFMLAAPIVNAADTADPYNTNATTQNTWGSLSGSGAERTMCQSFTAGYSTITKLKSSLDVNPGVSWGAGRTFTLALTSGGCYGQGGATNLQTKTLTQSEWEAFHGTTPMELTWTLGSVQSVTVGGTYYISLQDGSYCNDCYESYESSTSVYSGGALYYGTYNNGSYDVQTKDSYFAVIHDDASDIVYGVGPTTTIYSPPDGSNVPTSNFSPLEARASSSTLSASTTESMTFDWLIFHEGTLKGFRLDQAADLLYGAGYLADRVTFTGITAENGRWELRARACLGVACGVYSASQFDVADGSGTGTDAFVQTLTPFPAWSCGILAGFFDAVDCFMEYVRDVATWFFFPPPLWAFDPTSLFNFWKTRWPIAYLFGPLESWQAGFDAGATCPMPTFFGTEFNGQDVPAYDLCDTFGAVGPAIDGNAFGSTTLQWAIYLSGLTVALLVLKSLFDPK